VGKTTIVVDSHVQRAKGRQDKTSRRNDVMTWTAISDRCSVFTHSNRGWKSTKAAWKLRKCDVFVSISEREPEDLGMNEIYALPNCTSARCDARKNIHHLGRHKIFEKPVEIFEKNFQKFKNF
jgi:hypothetical protein